MPVFLVNLKTFTPSVCYTINQIKTKYVKQKTVQQSFSRAKLIVFLLYLLLLEEFGRYSLRKRSNSSGNAGKTDERWHVSSLSLLQCGLDDATDPWGVRVERVEVRIRLFSPHNKVSSRHG